MKTIAPGAGPTYNATMDAEGLPDVPTDKLDRARALLGELGSAVVAVSGGVDSGLALALSAEVLGAERVLAVTFTGPMFPPEEAALARELAGQCGVSWQGRSLRPDEDERIVANPPDRCYWCKKLLLGGMTELAGHRGLGGVVTGTTADDLDDYRPGRRAEDEAGVCRPLLAAGLRKPEVRAIARSMGLAVWDRASQACLASRVPYGKALTEAVLRRIGSVEQALREMGFVACRCRDHETVARIEVPPEDLARAVQGREAITAACRQAGYRYAALDLQGFRSGAMNEVL